jgi:hypothetical protein
MRFGLQSIFSALPFIKWMRETTLGANQWKNEATRFSWNVEEGHRAPRDQQRNNEDGENDDDILLRPMEIRTFVVGF